MPPNNTHRQHDDVFWVQLYNKRRQKPEGNVINIRLSSLSPVVYFADLIEMAVEKLKLDIGLHLINIYPSGTISFSQDEAFRPGDSVVLASSISSPSDPLIVIASEQKKDDDNINNYKARAKSFGKGQSEVKITIFLKNDVVNSSISSVSSCDTGVEAKVSLSPVSSKFTTTTTGTAKTETRLEDGKEVEANINHASLSPSIDEEEILKFPGITFDDASEGSKQEKIGTFLVQNTITGTAKTETRFEDINHPILAPNIDEEEILKFPGISFDDASEGSKQKKIDTFLAQNTESNPYSIEGRNELVLDTNNDGQSVLASSTDDLSTMGQDQNWKKELVKFTSYDPKLDADFHGKTEELQLYPNSHFASLQTNTNQNSFNGTNGRDSMIRKIEEFQIDKSGQLGGELFDKIYQILAAIYEHADLNETRKYNSWLIPSKKSINLAIEKLYERVFGQSKDSADKARIWKKINNKINRYRKVIDFDHKYIIEKIEEVNNDAQRPSLMILDVDPILNWEIVNCLKYKVCKRIVGLSFDTSNKKAILCKKCRGGNRILTSSKKRPRDDEDYTEDRNNQDDNGSGNDRGNSDSGDNSSSRKDDNNDAQNNQKKQNAKHNRTCNNYDENSSKGGSDDETDDGDEVTIKELQNKNNQLEILEPITDNDAFEIKELALKFASDEMRSDKDVVLEAVKENASALQYASEELVSDKDVITALNEKGIELGSSNQKSLQIDSGDSYKTNAPLRIPVKNTTKQSIKTSTGDEGSKKGNPTAKEDELQKKIDMPEQQLTEVQAENKELQNKNDQLEILEPITNEDAFEMLGGKEELKKYEKKSRELIQKVSKGHLLDDVINEILPPGDWISYSKKLINQPYVKNIDELYTKAEAVMEPFEKKIKKFGAETRSKAIVAPLKSRSRAEFKAKFKYKDGNGVSYYRITDIVRATLEFPDLDTMYKGAEKIIDDLGVTLKEFNDRFQNPLHGDYRDLQMTFELEGFMCELRISTESMMRAEKTLGHRSYQVYRELLAAVEVGDLDAVRAAKAGDLDAVREALQFGKNTLGSNNQDDLLKDHPEIRTLPHQAAKNGEADILDCLLYNGADPNAQDENGDTPLHHAIYNGNDRCVWLLINKYDCDKHIKNNDEECPLLKGFFMLYREDGEPQRRSMITLVHTVEIAELEKIIERKDEILKSKLSNSRLLVDYAADGDIPRMKDLLREFADPSSQKEGERALQAAVRNGRLEAVELLLKFKASTDVGNEENLLVQEALDRGRNDIARILINAGAECIGTNWEELVDYAEKKDKLKELEELLEWGVRNNNEAAVRLLLQKEAQTDHLEYPIVQEAIDGKHDNLKEILIENGACCRRIAPRFDKISCNKMYSSNGWNWSGIAAYKNKMFCTPHHAASVLVLTIDGDTNKLHEIPCDKGGSKWSGMALCGTKLYCAPLRANSILVIDGDNDTLSQIKCNVEGTNKWYGIARFDKKLFCAPHNASTILVIDTITNETKVRKLPNSDGEGISFDADGKGKWCGIARYGKKLFCAPFNASSVLVIDGESEEIHLVSVPGEENNGKWSGIARYENKLYCAPHNASSVLVIDGDTESITTIPCGDGSPKKWRDITRVGHMLMCAPYQASSVLIIDGETDKIMNPKCSYDNIDKGKWSAIAQYGRKLYCSPALYKGILVIED